MESYILGTGGMMPLPNRNLTSMLLRREGELFLFDCGEATQISLRQLNLKWKRISAIFISHTHADHITGLPGILMLNAQVQRDAPLYVIGPPKVKEYVEANIKALDMHINYPIEVREIDDPSISQEVYRGEAYSVQAIALRHTRVCVGYIFQENSRPGIFYPQKAETAGVPRGPDWGRLQRGETIRMDGGKLVHPQEVMGESRPGRKISYVTDTGWSDSISEGISGSDLLLCEAMFGDDLADSASEKKHLTASQAGKIASQADGVRKMGLFHFSPRYTNRELNILHAQCCKYFSNTFMCKDRMVIPIPYPDD